MVTLKEVAALAGVSVSTVSRALDGKSYVSDKTRKAVQQAAKKLEYRPNALAKSLKSGSTHTLALLIPDIQNPYLPMMVRGVEDEARNRGYTLILCNTDESIEAEREYLERLKNRWVDGFIISSMREGAEHVRALKEESFPVVLTARYYGGEFDTVAIDNVEAARAAVEYLLNLGNRRIAIALGNTELNVYRDRLKGYEKALNDAGMAVDNNLIVCEKTSEAMMERIAELARKEQADAVFATSDLKAIAVMRAIADAGRRIPEDVAVMGFDDIAMGALIEPPLTTVRQPLYDIGREAARKLIAQIEAKHQGRQYIHSVELLATKIIERRSTVQR